MTQGEHPGYGGPSQGYGQPGYGQPGYGQPGGYGPGAGNGAAAPAWRLGVPGLVLVGIGTVLLVLGYTVLNWFRSGTGGGLFNGASSDSRFGKLHRELEHLHNQIVNGGGGVGKYFDFGVSRLYFSWLGWVLLGVAVLAGVGAVLPTPASRVLRIVGGVVGLAGIGVSLWALDLISVSGPVAKELGRRAPRYSDWIGHSGIGPWATGAGFLLIAIGALLGAKRTTVTAPPGY